MVQEILVNQEVLVVQGSLGDPGGPGGSRGPGGPGTPVHSLQTNVSLVCHSCLNKEMFGDDSAWWPTLTFLCLYEVQTAVLGQLTGSQPS